MTYILSSMIWVAIFLVVPKINEKQNIAKALAMAVIFYECYLCAISGVMTAVHIPVDIYSISIVNFIVEFFCLINILKNKKIQNYYFKITDGIFVLFLIGIVLVKFYDRFTPELNIVFETSDPGTHLKMAMNLVNNKAVDGMYIGQLINGLFIESISKWFSGAFIYKAFIIQYGFNWFMSGFVFWATVQKYADNVVMRILVYISTIIYMMGYPYNDMLFGFVYLQMTITVIGFLFSVVNEYMHEKVNEHIYYIMMSFGCLGVSVGYTLFAPVVYFAVLFCIIYKFVKRDSFFSHTKFIVTKEFVFSVLKVFLFPTFITIWVLLILPIISGGSADYGNSLKIEGYIYRNLYFDFVIYTIPAIYGTVYALKKGHEKTFSSIMCPIFVMYYLYFLTKMLNGEVSTYYFYKLNFLMWMLVLVLFVEGMHELLNKEKTMFYTISGCLVVISTIYLSGFEIKQNAININSIPFTDVNSLFRVFYLNEMFEEKRTSISENLVKVSEQVNLLDANDDVIFFGYWQDLYWYEALTNQRFEPEIAHLSGADKYKKFLGGEYGEYAVITKSEYENFKNEYVLNNVIYENEYAYIVGK